MQLATKTLALIDEMQTTDQCSLYRQLLGKWVNEISDAYKPSEGKSFRGHLGASQIGRSCDRSIWYGYHWTKDVKFDSRKLRLFNRGHSEESRFCAILESIGCTIMQSDENGKQFGVSFVNNNFTGSGDGIAYGVPDVPEGEWCLLEFKTANDKSFKKLVKEGVQLSKPEYFTQVQIYLEGMGLKYALFMSVNKNDDTIHAEIIEANKYVAQHYIERAESIIYAETPPKRISDDFNYFECKWCDYAEICHGNSRSEIDTNCRSCSHSLPSRDVPSQWNCSKYNAAIPKDKALYGCKTWEMRGL